MHDEHVVLVLDDDKLDRVNLESHLLAHGYKVRLHAEPEDLFLKGLPQVPACLLLASQLGPEMFFEVGAPWAAAAASAARFAVTPSTRNL